MEGNYEDSLTINVNDPLNIHFGNSISNNTISNNGTIYSSGYTYASPALNIGNNISNSLDVKGNANFEGDLKIKGKSILETLEKIESRLAILQPDPAKLEKYEALRKAYEHYKLLEKLVQEN